MPLAMRFATATLASRIALGSRPNPIFVVTKKEAREPLFEQNKKDTELVSFLFWRRKRDSNPRAVRQTVFKTASL